jgi:hypothetical protein
MAPPENAIVICVDEKPSIQALERAQRFLKLPNGRALTGHSHEYKGQWDLDAVCHLRGGHRQSDGRSEEAPTARRVPRLHERYRRRSCRHGHHVILDNLYTHKPKNDRRLKRQE